MEPIDQRHNLTLCSYVVMIAGTCTMLPHLMNTPTALDTLLPLRQRWRDHNQTLVFTNGVFDLLHIGHLRYLEAARALGHVLVVGLNSDTSTRQIKGPQRPLVEQNDRAALLLGLRVVDYVMIFDEPTAEHLVAALQPDVYVKGGDYRLDSEPRQRGKPLPEAAIVQSYGGRVQLIPYLPGRSTTELIERITQQYG
jgi:rfaE bifunctional protein nucleotidyltransferase chain/domain